MTDTEWETYVRSLLNELSASFWTAPELAVYKSVALTLVNANFWDLLFPLKRRAITYSLAVGENYLDLPVGWHKIVRVEAAATGQELKPVPDSQLYYYLNSDPGTPVGYILYRGKVRILPDCTSVLPDSVRLWWLPRATTLADLPEDLHPLVAVEAVIAGRMKDENISPYILNLRDRFELIGRKALVQFQTQAPLAQDYDYSEDDDV